jgi:FtsP/CotA-like multicopper oxidase with cupredoxin domain
MVQEFDASDMTDVFPQDVEGLPNALPSVLVDLDDGDLLEMRIGPVRNSIGSDEVRMLAYNGSIPGPAFKVKQGTTVSVKVTNDAGLPQTVHWHGLRLENRFDGVPYETQEPISVGGTFTYRLQFPDPGLYWYHPHIREDYGQELGLYGQILVEPANPDYWPPVNRDIMLTLDDLLLEDGRIPVFHPSGPTHTMMGRFGNILLVNGHTSPTFDVTLGEVVRLYLTNTANTRPFNIAVDGAKLKLVGGDSGRYEREEMVNSVIISPSERAIIDALFDQPGTAILQNRTPQHTARLATFAVHSGAASPPLKEDFSKLRTDAELSRERTGLSEHLHRHPDKTLQIVGEMDMSGMSMGHMAMGGMDTSGTDTSGMAMGDMEMHGHDMQGHDMQGHDMQGHDMHGHDMHGTDMGDMDAPGAQMSHGNPMETDRVGETAMPEDHQGVDGNPTPAQQHEVGTGIEWDDTMPEMNLMSSPTNMVWKLIDTETGAVNHDIFWRFRVGDRVKIRLDNSAGSDHQMQHPFHIHGAGRFLVLDRGGVSEPNLVWKDTVLVRAGEVVNILFDVSSPGRWMAHCHIAEHIESGMMFSFDVLQPEPEVIR